MTGKAKPLAPEDTGRATAEDVVTEASIESFPASDAPGWIPATIGSATQTRAPKQRERKTSRAG